MILTFCCQKSVSFNWLLLLYQLCYHTEETYMYGMERVLKRMHWQWFNVCQYRIMRLEGNVLKTSRFKHSHFYEQCLQWHIPVGSFLIITAKSATGWPSNIVPFLYEPTARTSSKPCKEGRWTDLQPVWTNLKHWSNIIHHHGICLIRPNSLT